MSNQVLLAMQPGALELSLAATQDVIRERASIEKNWQQRIERTRIAAARAERQYHAAEPENRLVARTLEKRWEEALQQVRSLEEDHARFQRTQPSTPTDREIEQIRALVRDLPTLWGAPTTQPIDKQQIIRILVEQVVANVIDKTDRLCATITWTGGQKTVHETSRRVKRYEQLADFDRLLLRVRELRDTGHTSQAIAEHLNAEGYHTPYGTRRFRKKNVECFIRKYLSRGRQTHQRLKHLLKNDECAPTDLARLLGLGRTTIYKWMELGWVHYRKVPYSRPLYACWADQGELERLTELAKTPRHWYDSPLPSRLTTPSSKRRPQR